MGTFHSQPAQPEHEDAAETPEGLGDLPLAWLSLLIADHLHAEGRLALFQTGRPLSKAVLQHEEAQLTLSTASKQTAAQQAAAQALAAGASSLAVKLHGKKQAFQLQPCLWPCITSLELRKVTLPANWTHGLYGLPKLDILTLKSCQLPAAPPPGQRCPLSALRKCIVSQCTPLTQPLHQLRRILSGSQTLTHLVVDDRVMLVLVRDLPALTALQCTPTTHVGMQDDARLAVQDTDFVSLLTHPRLEHVVLGHLSILKDYSKHPCQWKTLQVLDGLQDVTIAQLPLAGLECFTVGSCVLVVDDMFLPRGLSAELTRPAAIITNLGSCQRVVFKATKGGGHREFTAPTFTTVDPCFSVGEASLGTQASERLKPRLLSMAWMAAQRVQGVLLFDACPLWPELLRVVRALNPAIHTLCFSHDVPAPPEFSSGLLSSLPSTVRHLVFGGGQGEATFKELLCSSRAPATLKLITFSEQGAGQQLTAAARQRVEAAAAQHQPHVRVQWKVIVPGQK